MLSFSLNTIYCLAWDFGSRQCTRQLGACNVARSHGRRPKGRTRSIISFFVFSTLSLYESSSRWILYYRNYCILNTKLQCVLFTPFPLRYIQSIFSFYLCRCPRPISITYSARLAADWPALRCRAPSAEQQLRTGGNTVIHYSARCSNDALLSLRGKNIRYFIPDRSMDTFFTSVYI